MPQSKVVREIDRSFRPPLTKLITSLRRSSGPMKSGLLLVEREQLVLVGREAEEVALLLDPLDRRALRPVADIALADLGEFGLGVVGLVADRIPAGIAVLVDVAIGRHPAPDRLAGSVVALLGGADEVVVGDIEHRRHVAEALGIAVGQFARRHAGSSGGLHHLDAVLVGAGQEVDVLAFEPGKRAMASVAIVLVGVADMRLAIRIGRSRS